MAINPDSAKKKTADLLTQIWQKNRPVLKERIALLRLAQKNLSKGSLPDDIRAVAASAAHKLAGTLGMFGLNDGTGSARQMELLLNKRQPDARQFAKHLSELEKIVASKDSKA
jgi:HPt (histidine-containing phosphotransfer) domain-containing protein